MTRKLLPDGWEVLEVFPEKDGETMLKVYDYQDNVDSVRVVVGNGNGDNTGNETPSEESLPANTLLKNGNMTGTGWHNGPGGAWLAGGSTDWWYATVIWLGRAELVDGRMKLETTGNNSYIEARNTSASYHGVNDESIAVEPSKEYVLQYEYETEYLSWDSNHRFTLAILMQESSGVSAGQIESIGYVKTTQWKTRVIFPFTTSATARYLNISPLIYGHTWNGTLQMKAWVDNISLVKKPSLSSEEQELEALIQEILWGIGLENNEEWIAINSYTLTDVQKNKLSEAVKRMTLWKTQEQIDWFNTALRNLEVKYAHNEIIIAMIRYMKNLLKISVIEYVEDISTWNIWGLHFKISQDILWSISNVWVEFINWNGVKEKQELKIQADGEYIVAFSNQSCNGCKNLKPYYLISWNTDTYTASFDDENIVVASSSYEIFRSVLTNIWFWKWYDKEYNRVKSWVIQKIIQIDWDIKAAPQDVSVDLILQTIASKSIDGINLKVSWVPTWINIETFPVAWYLLNKFLNGPRWDIRFNTEHWISQKIKNSRDYTNILSLIPNNYDISILEEGVPKIIVSSDSKFDKDFPVSNLDLYFGIWKYKYELSLLKEQGEIYTIVKFYDLHSSSKRIEVEK